MSTSTLDSLAPRRRAAAPLRLLALGGLAFERALMDIWHGTVHAFSVYGRCLSGHLPLEEPPRAWREEDLTRLLGLAGEGERR